MEGLDLQGIIRQAIAEYESEHKRENPLMGGLTPSGADQLAAIEREADRVASQGLLVGACVRLLRSEMGHGHPHQEKP
jgi:hypothetical protein